MSGYYDVYVLSDRRSKEAVDRFLNHFVPQRKESTDEYLVPMYSTFPTSSFDTAEDLLAYIYENPNEPHSIYWASENTEGPSFAMVFPTTDGRIVYGLSVLRSEQKYLEELKRHLNSSKGYIDFESSPPADTADFERFVDDFDAGESFVRDFDGGKDRPWWKIW